MTIKKAIDTIDSLKPNAYEQRDKIRWLSKLDGMIKKDIVDTHEGADEVAYEGYNEETNIETTELIAAAPHDEIYIKWLEAQIDYANGEMGKYNNSITAFNDEFTSFQRDYNRHHMPLTMKLKFF